MLDGVGITPQAEPGAAVTALIGPCAGACCYETGAEVRAALHGACEFSIVAPGASTPFYELV